jgi:hypothetical protein
MVAVVAFHRGRENGLVQRALRPQRIFGGGSVVRGEASGWLTSALQRTAKCRTPRPIGQRPNWERHRSLHSRLADFASQPHSAVDRRTPPALRCRCLLPGTRRDPAPGSPWVVCIHHPIARQPRVTRRTRALQQRCTAWHRGHPAGDRSVYPDTWLSALVYGTAIAMSSDRERRARGSLRICPQSATGSPLAYCRMS